MFGKLAYLKERLETSIWLIPISLCVVCATLGVLMLWLDRELLPRFQGLQVLEMRPASARQLLGVIAGSVISVGGVAFSVTMVALTLTSGQYGPKILRNFLEDSHTKLSLGLFLGTFIYALVVLAGLAEHDRPHLSVLAAVLLALLALIGFISFIHRTATDLQADKIVERIGGQLRAALATLAEEQQLAGRGSDTLPWRRRARGRRARMVAAQKRGYIQTIDYAALVRWCVANDCQLEVRERAGSFIVGGVCLFKVFGGDPESLEQAVEALDDHLVTGPIRTPVQDPEYPITQLSQLAARALSPGINDPGTAITCIDWFSLSLASVVDRDLPGRVFEDEKGVPRVLAKSTSFAGILKAIYAPLRQLAKSDVAVTASLTESLSRLAELTLREDRLGLLALHGTLIWQSVDTAALAAYDLADLKQRHRKLIALAARGRRWRAQGV